MKIGTGREVVTDIHSVTFADMSWDEYTMLIRIINAGAVALIGTEEPQAKVQQFTELLKKYRNTAEDRNYIRHKSDK